METYYKDNPEQFIEDVTRIFSQEYEPNVDTESVAFEVVELWKENHDSETTTAEDAAHLIAIKAFPELA